MEEIYVDWSGPYTYEDVVNYNENKIETKKSHGTGCTFSSAITAHLAKGFSVEESFRFAKKYISNSLLKGSLYKIGNGIGPVCHFQD